MSLFVRCLRGSVLVGALVLIPACEEGDDGAPGPAGPSIPVIQSLSAEGLPAPRSGTVNLTVQAQSPDGLTLSYAWSTSPATWVIASGGTSATVSITAPATYGASGTATVVVTDTAGRSGTGLVALSTVGNSAPIIHTISASPNPLPLARSMTAGVTASDPNGDTLAYTWTVPAGFTIAGGQGTAQISVTAGSVASGDISVSVSDGGAPAVVGSLFVSSRRGWGLPVSIESGAPTLNSAPVVAMNANGEAVAVWVQSDGVIESIWANRFTPSGGWGTAQTIETGSAAALFPEVVIDGGGNAIVVWMQSDGTAESLWTNRFTPGGGWGTASLLESSADIMITVPRLAGNPSGDAFVVWGQNDGGVASIWANRFTFAGGWEGATPIESSATAAFSPHVAMNLFGQAMAVWSQSGLIARRYVPGTGWEAPAAIGTAPLAPEVAMSANGEAVAVWRRSVSVFVERRWANRFTPTGGWGAETTLDAGPSDNSGVTSLVELHVAVDDFGFAIALWNQGTGTGSATLWANRGSTGGWETARPMDLDNFPAVVPRVAMAPNGGAIAVWNFAGAGVRASRFTPSGGWEATEVLNPTGFGASVALNSSGNATVVFADNNDGFAVHFR